MNSAYDWWLQNCKLGNEWAWVNKIAMIGYAWLFVYESPRRYQGRMNAAPEQVGPECGVHINYRMDRNLFDLQKLKASIKT